MSKTEKCIHHWIIETACGPISEGVCQNCNKKKSFSNSIGVLDMPRSLNLSTSNKLAGSLTF